MIQLLLSVAIMYAVVAAAGLWVTRKQQDPLPAESINTGGDHRHG